jgi:hypothetical protein
MAKKNEQRALSEMRNGVSMYAGRGMLVREASV